MRNIAAAARPEPTRTGERCRMRDFASSIRRWDRYRPGLSSATVKFRIEHHALGPLSARPVEPTVKYRIGPEPHGTAASSGVGGQAQRTCGWPVGWGLSSVGQAQPDQGSAGGATGEHPAPPTTQSGRRLRPRQVPDCLRCPGEERPRPTPDHPKPPAERTRSLSEGGPAGGALDLDLDLPRPVT